MVTTYTGVLREQGRIEWDGPVPTDSGSQVTVTVNVKAAVIAPTSEYARLLQVLAESGRGIETVIPDPVAWQQEMRSARVLNGRDDG